MIALAEKGSLKVIAVHPEGNMNVPKSLFPFAINMRPGLSSHKWTALSTSVNALRTH